MSKARQFALRFIELVMKCAPAESRSWGAAMLQEMDFIESDRHWLSWAMGSATALFRYSLAVRMNSLWQGLIKVKPSEPAKIIEGIFSGLGIATALLGACVLAYSRLLEFGPGGLLGTPFLIVLIFVLPEAGYALAIALFWKQKRPTAVGLLIAAAILFTHVLIHHATHL